MIPVELDDAVLEVPEMSDNSRTLAATALSALVLLASHMSLAGADEEAAWLSLSVGRGVQAEHADNELLNATAVAIGASVQPGANVFSFRYTRLGSESTTGDIALLVERPLVSRKARITAGAGVGLVYGNAVEHLGPLYGEKSTGGGAPAYQHAGAAWHVEVTTNSSSSVRAGMQGFGAVAGSSSFWGLALVLHLGPVGLQQGRCDR